MIVTQKDWFALWFNTPYYHVLYKHRDHEEAQLFMKNLVSFLNLKKKDRILDLACGRGRHSIFLNSLGFDVVGADLSPKNISLAKESETDSLHFIEHDMRNPFQNTYDAVFNLFTSFGFFEEDQEDIRILKNMKNGLNRKGLAVIDYMNCRKVREQLIETEIKEIDGIRFHISRRMEKNFILKTIRFSADGKQHEYIEKVKYIDLETFQSFAGDAGMKIKHIFGDYHLNAFDEHQSDRLILILE